MIEPRAAPERSTPVAVRVGNVDVLETNLWRTPARLFAVLDRRWRFGLDAAARAADALCPAYLGPDHDEEDRRNALECDIRLWQEDGPVYLNPPYSPGNLSRWIERASIVGRVLVPVVAVVPATPSTRWFAQAFETAHRIEFLTERVAFDRPDGSPSKSARGDTAVVTWVPKHEGPARVGYLDIQERHDRLEQRAWRGRNAA